MGALIRELLPPILLRAGQKLFRTVGASRREIRGMERGPEFYDQAFCDHDHLKSHYTESRYYPLWAIVADRLVRSGRTSVLDIGCGPGQFASLLRDKGVTDYLGIDFSSERVKHARKTCPCFEFVQADVFDTDVFGVRQYDAAVCLEVLEHVDRDIEILSRVRAETWFWGTVPNFPSAGHVRHFDSAEEVAERYRDRFEEFSVDTHQASEGGMKFFLFEGLIK